MKVISSLVLLAVCSVYGEEEELDIEFNSLRGRSTAYKNHQVCDQISQSAWWASRLDRKNPGMARVLEMDQTCEQFNNNVDACKAVRQLNGVQTRCEVVGAHSHLCRANPCNHLNDGNCNLDNTHGECAWFTESDKTTFNNYWKDPVNAAKTYAKDILPSKGCFRNPCNMAGYGKPPNAPQVCSDLSVPGLYQCTWCKVKGAGMGCQMTEVGGPSAECATNDLALKAKEIEKASVVQRGITNPGTGVFIATENGKCQCSTEYPLCAELAGVLAGPTLNDFYRRRF